MGSLETRVARLEQASAPPPNPVRVMFQQPGETREQLEQRAAADGWQGETLLVVGFDEPKAKNPEGAADSGNPLTSAITSDGKEKTLLPIE